MGLRYYHPTKGGKYENLALAADSAYEYSKLASMELCTKGWAIGCGFYPVSMPWVSLVCAFTWRNLSSTVCSLVLKGRECCKPARGMLQNLLTIQLISKAGQFCSCKESEKGLKSVSDDLNN
jgi:hypothetical protein